MEELIIYLMEKREQLLQYRTELKQLAQKKDNTYMEKLKQYDEIVERVQIDIAQIKEALKKEIEEEVDKINSLNALVEQVYPEEMKRSIQELSETEKELKIQRKNNPQLINLIHTLEKLIPTLKARIDFIKKSRAIKKKELCELIPSGQSASEYLIALLERIRMIDELSFKNLDEYIKKFGLQEKSGSDNGMRYITNENLQSCLRFIEHWCSEHFDENVPFYLRRLPRMSIAENGGVVRCAMPGETETVLQEEYRAGIRLNRVKQSRLIKEFESGKSKDNYSPEELAIIERYQKLEENYGYAHLNIPARNLISILEWCETNFKGKPVYLRRRPRSQIAELEDGSVTDQYEITELNKELKLGIALSNFRGSSLYQKYLQGKTLSSAELEVISLYHAILQEYDIDEQKANLLELKEWCEEKRKLGLHEHLGELLTKGIYTKKARRTKRNMIDETEEERRIRLGRAFSWFQKGSPFFQKYRAFLIGKENIENRAGNIPPEDKEIIQLYLDIQDIIHTHNDKEPEDGRR